MKKIIAFVLACVMVCSLCAMGAFAEDKPVLVLGTSADYAPYEFMYPDEDGNMVYGGIDIEIAQYIADYLGMDLAIENMDFGYLLTALNKGDFDIVMADIESTEKRQKAVDFSDVYYEEIPERFLCRAEDADKLVDCETDFDGLYVGAQTGSTKVEKVQNLCVGAECVSLQLVTDLVNELVNGKIDAILLDGSVAEQYAASEEGLAIAPASSVFGEDAIGINVAVAKGDPKGLLDGLNEAIAQLKEEGFGAQALMDVNEILGLGTYEEVTADAPEGYEADE